MDYIKRAHEMRKIIEQEMVKETDDKILSMVPNLLPGLKYDGSVIEANTPIRWGDKVLRANTTLYDREQYSPGNSPESWKEVKFFNGVRIIPDKFEPGDLFKKGERGYYKELLYEAIIDNVVWNPDEYPNAWIKIE